MLKNPSIVFAVTVDNNGYLPTHNTKYTQPITGEKDKDKVGNRTKRIFNDPTGLAAAKNTQPGFVQVYKRDTGETMWDVSSPIIVKGKQWGNFRIGLSIDALQKAKNLYLYLCEFCEICGQIKSSGKKPCNTHIGILMQLNNRF